MTIEEYLLQLEIPLNDSRLDFLKGQMKAKIEDLTPSQRFELTTKVSMLLDKSINPDLILVVEKTKDAIRQFQDRRSPEKEEKSDLTLMIDIPEHLTADEAKNLISELVIRVNQLYRMYGGNGLKIDTVSSVEVGELAASL